jgi:hypothetical protein
MTSISLHMQWPLISQLHGSVSQREQLFFSLRIQLHPQSKPTFVRIGLRRRRERPRPRVRLIGRTTVSERRKINVHHGLPDGIYICVPKISFFGTFLNAF